MDFLRNLFGKKQPATPEKNRPKLPRQVERLVSDLNDKSFSVRFDAVKELGNLRNPHAFEVLVKVFENRDENDGIRIMACEAIWEIDPKWLPNIPGLEVVEECVSQLVSLYDQTPRGEGFDSHSDSTKPVEQIGKRLNQAGGIDLMVLAHRRFRQQRPIAARNLEYCWDGIGSWRG